MLGVHALPALPGFPVLLALGAAALVPWRGRAPLAAFALGVLFTVWHAQRLLDERWPGRRHGEDVAVSGAIAGLPEHGAQVSRFLLEPSVDGLPRRIRVGWYEPAQRVRAGECWRFVLRLRTPHGSLNPHGFDYEGWLFRQGIGAVASVREAQPCGEADGHALARWRQRIVEHLHDALPRHPALAFVTALTVGDDSGFDAADWDVFRLTGTSHLVAISGFNVAIVAGVAFFAFRWLWSAWPRACLWLPAQRAGLLGATAGGVAYALLAGFEPPVQRAAVMLLVVAAAAWTHRLAEASRVLAVALAAVLALDPLAILSPGLWLSFGAVAAIFYVSVGRLRAPGFWHAAVFLQLMLAVALAPLTLFFFQGASWLAPLVNLAAVPLFALLTPAVLAASLAAWAWPPAGLPALELVADALWLFRRALELVAAVPDLWLAARPADPALLLGALAVALLFAPRGLPLRPLGALALAPLFWPGTAAESPLKITALDVGQGLAIVVRTPGHALLYDAGPAFEDGFDAGASVVAPFLLGQGITTLDRLVLSHADNDHAGGVPAVRRLLDVRDELGTSAARPCRAGASWEWDGVRFDVLHPADGGWDGNDASCVLRVASADFSALLAGDVEAAAERDLVRRRGPELRADVLIAPHHGSRTSSTPGFVAAASPRIVIYGAGWKNHFRHPRPDVVARYAALGARQVVTGASGAVTVEADGRGGVRLEEHRRGHRRFWNAPAAPGPDASFRPAGDPSQRSG